MKSILNYFKEVNPDAKISEIETVLSENLRFGFNMKYSFRVKNKWIIDKLAKRVKRKLCQK